MFIFSRATKTLSDYQFKMAKKSGLQRSHCCGLSCLGPLTFHEHAVGDMVTLSQGGRLAERAGNTFRNGLVFSSRPVKVQERVRLRVERHLPAWHGALRVGFTTVPPTARTLPLPSLLIPDLSDTPGHWAAYLPETYCYPGSELELWVSHGGHVYIRSNSSKPHKLLQGVNLSQPLWAIMEVYGQTGSILLLGSKKKCMFGIRKSCPVPEHLPSLNVDNHYNSHHVPDVYSCSGRLGESNNNCISYPATELPLDSETVTSCVVCMDQEASFTLWCGHQCLCQQCAFRVIKEFGSCPLCRYEL